MHAGEQQKYNKQAHLSPAHIQSQIPFLLWLLLLLLFLLLFSGDSTIMCEDKYCLLHDLSYYSTFAN